MKEFIAYDDYNSYIPSQSDILGSITTTIGHSALRDGWKIIEVHSDDSDVDSGRYICNGQKREIL